MNVFEVGIRTRTEEEAYEYAKELGLARRIPPLCSECGREMNIEKGKIRHGIDGRYRCGLKCCRKSMSLFADTIFESAHMPISKCIRAIYLKSMKLKTSQIAQELCTTRETISDFLSKITAPILDLNISQMFGKLSATVDDNFVEIDETHLVTRRDARGRILKGERYWIIGAICRATKQIRLELIRQRPASVCESFVVRNIEMGSNIVTDMWRGYVNVGGLGYNHYKINHRTHFVDPEDRNIHTQTVERLWRDVKENIDLSMNSFQLLRKQVKYYEWKWNLNLKSSSEIFSAHIEINLY